MTLKVRVGSALNDKVSTAPFVSIVKRSEPLAQMPFFAIVEEIAGGLDFRAWGIFEIYELVPVQPCASATARSNALELTILANAVLSIIRISGSFASSAAISDVFTDVPGIFRRYSSRHQSVDRRKRSLCRWLQRKDPLPIAVMQMAFCNTEELSRVSASITVIGHYLPPQLEIVEIGRLLYPSLSGAPTPPNP